MKRESNFELLRIVAIIFITIHHLLINGLNICGYNKAFDISGDSAIAVLLNSLCVGGVNTFILISGWFGIKHIVRNVIRLLFDCAVYGLMACLIYLVCTNDSLNIYEFLNSMKFTSGWYVPNYIWLLLVSPIIEKSLLNINLKTLRLWILILSICQIYLGYYLKFVDANGYSAINFIYLYYIGRYLRLEEQNIFYKKWANYGGLLWLVTGLILGFIYLAAAYMHHTIESVRFWSYNNPLVLLGSVSVFVFFSIIKIQSNFINYFATSVLGVYLLSSNSLITSIRNYYAIKFFDIGGYCLFILYAFLLVFFIGAIILIVNKLREPILTKLYKMINVF